MTLPPPAPRRRLHTRSIVCEGFQRDDGLWDIEARMVDTKTYAYDEPIRGHRAVGEPVHDMAVRLTLDDAMVVRRVEVAMPSAPYGACPGAIPAYQSLIGRRVGPGWRAAVREAVGGTRGCTHVRELLLPMASVAFQTMTGFRDDADESASPSGDERPYFVDACRAWASDGEMVATLYPRFAVRRG